jgi:hypothetical protein
MVASAFGNVASTHGLCLKNLRQRKGRLLYHFAKGVFVLNVFLRTFGGEEDPQQHSFVTASWVETHNIPIAPMYPTMRVSSIGGRTQTDKFCPSARVQIRGIDFPADLIVMGTRDAVVEPSRLFQLKCPRHASEAATHLNRNNPSVP